MLTDEKDLYLPYPPVQLELSKFEPEKVRYTLYPLAARNYELEQELLLDQIEYDALLEGSEHTPDPTTVEIDADLESFEQLAKTPDSLSFEKYHIGDTPFQLLVFNQDESIIDVWDWADPEAFIWLHQQHLDRRKPFASIEKALTALERARRKHTIAELRLPKLIQRRGGLWQTADRRWEITYLDHAFTIKNWDEDIKEGNVPSLQEARLRIHLWDRTADHEWTQPEIISGARLRFGPGEDQLDLITDQPVEEPAAKADPASRS